MNHERAAPYGRRKADHQRIRPFVDRWGVYIAVAIMFVVVMVSLSLVERTVRQQRQDRIAQCESGNMLRQHLRDLARDLGADATTSGFVAKEFPFLNCEHPGQKP